MAKGMMGCGVRWRGLEVAQGVCQRHRQRVGHQGRPRFCPWGGEVRRGGERQQDREQCLSHHTVQQKAFIFLP